MVRRPLFLLVLQRRAVAGSFIEDDKFVTKLEAIAQKRAR